jgi:hypothetical protein
MMINILIVFLSIIITLLYVIYVPIRLKYKSIKIDDNQFQDFVNNDSGYAWSRLPERKRQYKQNLIERQINNKKQ